jgi:hypothetical protein
MLLAYGAVQDVFCMAYGLYKHLFLSTPPVYPMHFTLYAQAEPTTASCAPY